MKYKVRAAGLYHHEDYFASGVGFPANLKGFDYNDALERGLIEENEDGELPSRPVKESPSPRLQSAPDKRNTDKADS